MKTLYLAPQDVQLLMTESLRRQSATGKRKGADFSSLVREAIRKTFTKRSKGDK